MTTLLEINMTTHLTSKSVKALMISEFPGDDRLCYSWTIAGGRPNADFTRSICAGCRKVRDGRRRQQLPTQDLFSFYVGNEVLVANCHGSEVFVYR